MIHTNQMADQFIPWFKRYHGLSYMRDMVLTLHDGRTFWHICTESQTDWYNVLLNVTGSIWIARRSRSSCIDADAEHVIEMYDGQQLVYDGPLIELAGSSSAFPEWYQAMFHPHMFCAAGSDETWTICPQNQLDWKTHITHHSGIWLVQSHKDDTQESLVRAYTGINSKIYESQCYN